MLPYFLLNFQVQYTPWLRSYFSSPKVHTNENGLALQIQTHFNITNNKISIVNSEYQLTIWFLLASIKSKN